MILSHVTYCLKSWSSAHLIVLKSLELL